ncbi:hypothetical protein LEN26_002517 [Aphanomyces euteiches]|nr:hypothetical protein AeMF1_002966 [Aphanomyces euteiches]KAH9159094.1 hypothetical protein LEN26_002517 [Aphanomyces euteiches]KAH9189982.1 hypothetical protein AeNC1_008045 [Aphanomyces euteiches]
MMSERVFFGLLLALVAPVCTVVQSVLVALATALIPRSQLDFRGKHVFITGGSEGLGRSIALQLVEEGADVTISARRKEVLERVISDANRSHNPRRGRIFYQTADVTQPEAIAAAVAAATARFGPIDVVIPCAGKGLMGYIKNHSMEMHRKAMDLNYFATLASLLTHRANMQSVVLADCLRNELGSSGISVHIAFPGVMDTPGYAEELLTTPQETWAIEASETLYHPDVVARTILKDLKRGEYNLYGGDLGIQLLGVLAGGMAPRSNSALDMLLFPIAVIVSPFVRGNWTKQALGHNKA